MAVFFSGKRTLVSGEDLEISPNVVYFSFGDLFDDVCPQVSNWNMVLLMGMARFVKCAVVTGKPYEYVKDRIGECADLGVFDLYTSFILRTEGGAYVDDGTIDMFSLDDGQRTSSILSSIAGNFPINYYPDDTSPKCITVELPCRDCAKLFASLVSVRAKTIYNDCRVDGRLVSVVHCGTDSIVNMSAYNRTHPVSLFVGDVSGAHSRLAAACNVRIDSRGSEETGKAIKMVYKKVKEAQ